MSHKLIQLAEKKWKAKLIQYLSELFTGHILPSHDLNHHNRVWKNACELSLTSGSLNEDQYFYEKLLLACFFHDTGLIEDRGENHGAISKKFCENFLSQNECLLNFSTSDVLAAIEFHDDKNYADSHLRSSDELYNLLTIADDLDAFGAIGAYRYIEIYLLRGVNIKDIPSEILSNVKQRFDYFKNSRYNSELNHAKHQNRYETIVSLLKVGSFMEEPLTLISWVNNEVVLPGRDPFQEFSHFSLNNLKNGRVETFLDKFKDEIGKTELL